MMRIIYTTIILVLAAAVLIFCIQNLANAVTVDFLVWSSHLRVPLLVIIVYALGMLTGSWTLGFVRRSIHGATAKPKQS